MIDGKIIEGKMIKENGFLFGNCYEFNFDGLVKSLKMLFSVIPAKAGIQ